MFQSEWRVVLFLVLCGCLWTIDQSRQGLPSVDMAAQTVEGIDLNAVGGPVYQVPTLSSPGEGLQMQAGLEVVFVGLMHLIQFFFGSGPGIILLCIVIGIIMLVANEYSKSK